MIETGYHKIRQTLGRLDNYLLRHFPMLWSCSFIPFIAYNLLLAWVFTMTAGMVPVAIFDMPDTGWILMIFAVTATGGLAGWLYIQSLLDAVYYHGSTRRFFPVKFVSLFFGVFLTVAMSVTLPWLALNRRIVYTLTDPQLPPIQIGPPASNAPGDTLIIDYNTPIHSDTIHSYKFEMTIHTVQLKAKVYSSHTKIPRDTTIGRFFFYSPYSRDTVVSDSANIGLRCLTERICHCFAESGSYFTPDQKQPLITDVEAHYFAACNELAHARLTIWTAGFAACLLATLALFIYSFIRFFGSWLFFVGLTVPCFGGGLFSSDLVFRSGLREHYYILLWVLLFLFCCFAFIRRRRSVDLMAFQTSSYATIAILLLFPVEMPHTTTQWTTPTLLGITMLAFFTFSILLITKVCRLYERPGG